VLLVMQPAPVMLLPLLPLALMGDLHPASMKSLLWLITPCGCTLGREAEVTLSVCRVARRLAMLLLSRAPMAASLEAEPWVLRLPAKGGRSLFDTALRVLRYTLSPAADPPEAAMLPAAAGCVLAGV